MGIIYADINGLGGLTKHIARDEKRYGPFCENLAATLRKALLGSVTSVLKDAVKKRFPGYSGANGSLMNDEALPVKILYLGGDDLALAVQGCYALDIASCLLETFERESAEMLKGSGIEALPACLTICAGVVIAPHTYPILSFNRIGRDLESRAKFFSRATQVDGINPSCVDFCLVQNNSMGSLSALRAPKILKDASGDPVRFLYGGPYEASELGALKKASLSFGQGSFPRNKLKSGLTSVLSRGSGHAESAYSLWFKGLKENEQTEFVEVVKDLGIDRGFPFKPDKTGQHSVTPIIDAIEMMTLYQLGESGGK